MIWSVNNYLNLSFFKTKFGSVIKTLTLMRNPQIETKVYDVIREIIDN